ncbi:MAG: CDP-alcohol phosphatidyltransferase family protein [Euryarchaeota archaeon]|nr:CDP-alcohol phosphatidyltransferase family protein [Euryarchaeota archaeon]
MVLDTQRENVDPFFMAIAKRFSKIDPNVLTWLSLVFAIVAGLFFYFSSKEFESVNFFLCVAVIFVSLNGLFDAIDGKVAKLTNKVSKKGDFLDHALDRYADVFMVGGLALSSWCDTRIGLLAIVGMLLTSYMGTQSQAVGYQREYSGLLGRADRLVILMVTPVIQHMLLYSNIQMPWGISLLSWILIYFAVVGNITAVQRFYNTLKWFGKRKK